MKRYFLFTSTLIVVFSVTIFLCRQIGLRGKNPSPLTGVFTNPDGSPCEMPCLFGIRLGKTTFDDAVLLLNGHPLTRDIGKPDLLFGSYSFHYLRTPCTSIGLDTFGGEFVRHIQIEDSKDDKKLTCPLDLSTATLATSISLFGEPDTVKIGEGEGDSDVAIYYTPIHLKIIYTRGNYYKFATWQQDSLEFSDPFNFLIMSENVVPKGYIANWIGFMRVEKYDKAIK